MDEVDTILVSSEGEPNSAARREMALPHSRASLSFGPKRAAIAVGWPLWRIRNRGAHGHREVRLRVSTHWVQCK